MGGAVLLPGLPAAVGTAHGTGGEVPRPAAADCRPALDWERFVAERLDAGSRDLYAECLALWSGNC